MRSSRPSRHWKKGTRAAEAVKKGRDAMFRPGELVKGFKNRTVPRERTALEYLALFDSLLHGEANLAIAAAR